MTQWYECPYCGILLPTQELLENHIAVEHPEEPPPTVYTCPYCGAEFPTSTALSSHISLVHPPVPPPVYTCPYCGAEFDSEAALNSHIETAHPPAVVPCEIAITAPDSAKEGEEVSVSVGIKNVSERTYTYKTEIYAVPDLYPDYLIGGGERTLFPEDREFYDAPFTMPDCNTTVFVRVYRLSAGEWVYDNVDSKVVSLEVVPVYKGTISKKELEYDETRGAIPVY